MTLRSHDDRAVLDWLRAIERAPAETKSLSFPIGHGWSYSTVSQFDLTGLVGDRGTNSVVSVCIRYLWSQMSQGELRVGKRNPDGTYDETDSPITDLWARFNPFWSGTTSLYGLIESLVVDGNAYVLKVRPRISSKAAPVELYWVPNHTIQVETTDSGTQAPVKRYWFTQGSARKAYEPSEVIHFRWGVSKHNWAFGRSPLDAQDSNVAGLNVGERYTSAVLRNGNAGKIITPKEIVGEVFKDSTEEDEMRAIQRRLEQGLSGENAGKYQSFNLPVELQDAGMGPEQMRIDSILDRPESTLVAALGLNTLVLGLTSSASTRTYSNLAEGRKAAHEDGVLPKSWVIAEGIKSGLVPDFHGKDSDLICWFDFKDVPALKEDANERSTRAVAIFSGDLATKDEARDMIGLPPVGPERNGDRFLSEIGAEQAKEIAEATGQGQGQGDGGDPADPFAEEEEEEESSVKAIEIGQRPPADRGKSKKLRWITVKTKSGKIVHVKVPVRARPGGGRRYGKPYDDTAGTRGADRPMDPDLQRDVMARFDQDRQRAFVRVEGTDARGAYAIEVTKNPLARWVSGEPKYYLTTYDDLGTVSDVRSTNSRAKIPKLVASMKRDYAGKSLDDAGYDPEVEIAIRSIWTARAERKKSRETATSLDLTPDHAEANGAPHDG